MEAEKGRTTTPTTWKEKDNDTDVWLVWLWASDAIHWVREYKTLSSFWGGIWWVSFWVYWVWDGSESRWRRGVGSYIHDSIALKREWTVEGQIGVYHHIDGDWNFGSGWDWPGRERTAEKKLLIASRSLGANNSIEAASCSSCLLFKCWEHQRLRCLGTRENAKTYKVGKHNL